jgi:hypothetical protein
MLDQVDSFLTKGYCIFDEKGLLDLTEFAVQNVEEFEGFPMILDAYTDIEQQKINMFVQYVSEKYVESLYKNYEVLGTGVWDGVDSGSMGWHNDHNEGIDFNVLLYNDDTDDSTGGQIEFQYPGGQECIYPKSGNLIFINQDLKFKHKASRSTGFRRVATIEYGLRYGQNYIL